MQQKNANDDNNAGLVGEQEAAAEQFELTSSAQELLAGLAGEVGGPSGGDVAPAAGNGVAPADGDFVLGEGVRKAIKPFVEKMDRIGADLRLTMDENNAEMDKKLEDMLNGLASSSE